MVEALRKRFLPIDIEELRSAEFYQLAQKGETVEEMGIKLQALARIAFPSTAVRPAVRIQYNHCRSRKSIRGHIPVYDFLPVYILYILQALSMEHFTSTTPNKDQKVEQVFCCPSVPDL